jgi:hypothetical protein
LSEASGSSALADRLDSLAPPVAWGPSGRRPPLSRVRTRPPIWGGVDYKRRHSILRLHVNSFGDWLEPPSSVVGSSPIVQRDLVVCAARRRDSLRVMTNSDSSFPVHSAFVVVLSYDPPGQRGRLASAAGPSNVLDLGLSSFQLAAGRTTLSSSPRRGVLCSLYGSDQRVADGRRHGRSVAHYSVLTDVQLVERSRNVLMGQTVLVSVSRRRRTDDRDRQPRMMCFRQRAVKVEPRLGRPPPAVHEFRDTAPWPPL